MELQALAGRVEALERQNRQLRRCLAVVGLAGLAAVGMAQVVPVPDEVRTRRLVLLDSAGEMRAELTTDREMPALTLRDAEGHLLIELTGDGSRAAIVYRDHRGDLEDLAAPPGVRPLTKRDRP
jgi:hypothetical protein